MSLESFQVGDLGHFGQAFVCVLQRGRYGSKVLAFKAVCRGSPRFSTPLPFHPDLLSNCRSL